MNLRKRAANSLTSFTAVMVPGAVQAAGQSLLGVGPMLSWLAGDLSPPDPVQGAVFLQIDDQGLLGVESFHGFHASHDALGFDQRGGGAEGGPIPAHDVPEAAPRNGIQHGMLRWALLGASEGRPRWPRIAVSPCLARLE
jgi:hypothetical protein